MGALCAPPICVRATKSTTRTVNRAGKRFQAGISTPFLTPEICGCHVEHFVCPAVHDGLNHKEREPLRHLKGDLWWNRELLSVDYGIDEHRPVVSKGSGDAGLDIGRFFEPNAANADCLSHLGEVWIFERCAKIQESGCSLFEFNEAERTVVEHHDFDWQAELHEGKEITHQHREATITRKRYNLALSE